MSTLAHVLEENGLATVSLGIIEQQLVSTGPPRGLFVDFPLGRPLGKPGDAAFQQRVIDHAFSLLESDEPVIETFAEPIIDEGAVLACAIPPQDDPDAHPAVAEARGLRAAYNRTVAKHDGRLGTYRVIGPDDVVSAIESVHPGRRGHAVEGGGHPRHTGSGHDGHPRLLRGCRALPQ